MVNTQPFTDASALNHYHQNHYDAYPFAHTHEGGHSGNINIEENHQAHQQEQLQQQHQQQFEGYHYW